MSILTKGPPAARSVNAFAQHHGLGRSRVYELIAAGTIIARKCGSRTLIFDDDNLNFRLALPLLKPRGAVWGCPPTLRIRLERRTTDRAPM